MVEKIKNPHHQEILKRLRGSSGKKIKRDVEFERKYVGTDKICYSLRSAEKDLVVREFLRKHHNLSLKEFVALLNSLYKGESHEELSIAGKLLEQSSKFKKDLDINLLDRWLNNVKGWSEVDSLCQSNFGAKEMLSRWQEWERLVRKLSRDKNIHKRRASLVLLTKVTRESADLRPAKIAFTNIEKLKGEKDVLITKAISWLLRDLIKHHRKDLEAYLKKNAESLPKIAVRETMNKLKTGRKSGK